MNYGQLANTYVVARDPDAKKILIGGLGTMGVGQLWFDEEPDHKNYSNYKTAKIEKFTQASRPLP